MQPAPFHNILGRFAGLISRLRLERRGTALELAAVDMVSAGEGQAMRHIKNALITQCEFIYSFF